MAVQDQILTQLADIQRTLGEVYSTVNGLSDRVHEQETTLEGYQQVTTAALNNALTRLGELEKEVRVLKMTFDKTVMPLVNERVNVKQRVIGFIAAFTIMGTIGGAVFAFLTSGWAEIAKIVGRIGNWTP